VFVKPYRDRRGNILIAASLSRGRIVLADYASRRLIGQATLPADCKRAYDVHVESLTVATGYWSLPSLYVWRLNEHPRWLLELAGRLHVWDLMLDESGRCVLYAAGEGVYAQRASGGEAYKLKGVKNLGSGSFDQSKEGYLLPKNAPGALLHYHFSSGASATISIPVQNRVLCIRRSPRHQSFCVIDERMRVYCFDYAYSLLWERDVSEYRQSADDGAYVGAYSGNGEVFGVTVTHLSTFTLVALNTSDGSVMSVVRDCHADGVPFEDETIVSEAGQVVDLTRGKVIADLGDARWWRACGA
jgi:hypothetical protein